MENQPKGRRGRPRIATPRTRRAEVYFTIEQDEYLEACVRKGIARTEVVRQALDAWIKEHPITIELNNEKGEPK